MHNQKQQTTRHYMTGTPSASRNMVGTPRQQYLRLSLPFAHANRWRHIPVNPELKGIWEHIRDLGLGALAHANRHAAYAAMENPRWPDLSVLQAAHSAELLIKARIAQEHPLLIFEQLPRL